MKTFVIWLGGRQQVTNVEVNSVAVLSSTVIAVESERDLVSSVCWTAGTIRYATSYPQSSVRCRSTLPLHWLPVRQRVAVAGHVSFQNPTWFSRTVPGRRLSTRHCLRSTSTTIVRRQYVRHSTHPHSSRRPLLRCRWTTSVQQSPYWTSPPQPRYRTVP